MRYISVLGALLFCAAPAAAQVTFEQLPVFEGITDVSNDGSIVAGYNPVFFAGFIWNRSQVMHRLTLPPEYRKVAVRGISGDGRIIAGTLSEGVNGLRQQAFRYTISGGFEYLDDLGEAGDTIINAVDAISRDGRTVMGTGRFPGGAAAVTWVAGSPTPLVVPIPDGAPRMLMAGASDADASHIAMTDFHQSFLWHAGALTAITPIDPYRGVPTEVSDHGDVVAGGPYAWRWSEADGFEALPTLPDGRHVDVYAMSADGEVLAGGNNSPWRPLREESAFYWTRETGLVLMKDLLIERGINMDDWTLKSVDAISADGQTLFGRGVYTNGFWQSWTAFVPRPAVCSHGLPCSADFDRSGAVDWADLGAFFNSWQRGEACGDFDRSGGVDGEDVGAFIGRWQVGC